MLWSLSFLAAGAAAKILYAGVNESGGEFGVWSNTATPGTGLPGRFGVDYAFINKVGLAGDIGIPTMLTCSASTQSQR
jgi:hypothetical protein